MESHGQTGKYSNSSHSITACPIVVELGMMMLGDNRYVLIYVTFDIFAY